MTSLQQDDRCPACWTDEASRLHLYLLPQALPSELKIVEGPAGTIKLPFRKLNLIFCEQLGERASKATLELCASIESATFRRLPVPAAKDLSPVKLGFQESRAGFDTVMKNAVPFAFLGADLAGYRCRRNTIGPGRI